MTLNRAYNEFHNILRLFVVLVNFSFTTSETMSHELPHELPNDLKLRILGNYERSGKCLNPIE